MANLLDRFFFRFFFYSNNVQNIDARRINLSGRLVAHVEYTRRLHSNTVNIVSSGAVDY